MAGIYVHIPFCRSKCSYCDFCSVAIPSLKSDFLQALKSEFTYRSPQYRFETFNTLYIGGGTPSLLNISELETILKLLFSNFTFSKDCEITLETNPDDLSIEYLMQLKQLGVNRLSIGIQSLNDNTLKMMRRRHNADQAIKSVYNAAEAGFNNISTDIIYGIEGLSIAELKLQIKTMLSMPITHLSAYHLGIEKGTLLYRQQKDGKINKIDDEQSFNQYLTLIETTAKNGFEQYEISNFAKNEMISQHNSSYWKRTPYLGFGPSAHSFTGIQRFYNTSDVKKYISEGKNNIFTPEIETLSTNDIINETIMLELRTTKGIYLDKYLDNFGKEEYDNLFEKIRNINGNYYIINNNCLSLTLAGMFVSDNICETLFK